MKKAVVRLRPESHHNPNQNNALHPQCGALPRGLRRGWTTTARPTGTMPRRGQAACGARVPAPRGSPAASLRRGLSQPWKCRRRATEGNGECLRPGIAAGSGTAAEAQEFRHFPGLRPAGGAPFMPSGIAPRGGTTPSLPLRGFHRRMPRFHTASRGRDTSGKKPKDRGAGRWMQSDSRGTRLRQGWCGRSAAIVAGCCGRANRAGAGTRASAPGISAARKGRGCPCPGCSSGSACGRFRNRKDKRFGMGGGDGGLFRTSPYPLRAGHCGGWLL